MSTQHKPMRMPGLVALLLASVGSLAVGTPVEAKAQSVITIDQLAGPWQIGVVGNTIAAYHPCYSLELLIPAAPLLEL